MKEVSVFHLFGETLRARREAAGKSLRDVARFVGVSVPYLSDVERGRRNPFLVDRIELVAAYIGADPVELVNASAVSRGHVLLRIDTPSRAPARTDLAIALAQRWSRLDEATALRLRMVLEESVPREARNDPSQGEPLA